MSSLKISKSGRIVSKAAPAAEAATDGFWRNMAELEDKPEFQEFLDREYPQQNEQRTDPLSRRRFVQLMGASFAFAGVAQGCRWEEEKILPLSRRPEGYIPGVAKKYATGFELGGVAAGLLVTCMDGRPIKIEGNPDHPFSGGASTALAQASILNLYDPDRSKSVRRQENGKAMAATRKDAVKALRALRDQAIATSGAGMRILTEASSSRAIATLRAKIQEKMPNIQWHEYEPLSRDEEREGNKLAFGTKLRTHYRLDKCDVIATFDAELFGNSPAALRHADHFARKRDPDNGRLNRLYVIESSYSLTGSVADHRLPMRSELIKPILLGLEKALAGGSMGTVGSEVLAEPKVSKFVAELSRDLKKNRSKSVVVVGASQPADVHALAARINDSLGNAGSTVFYAPSEEAQDRGRHVDDAKALAVDMKSGKVAGLLILGGNPAYDMPADLDFGGAMAKVKISMHLSMYEDETSKLSNWHLNRAHYLETWGDSRSYDGTQTVQQPLLEPLYDGMSMAYVLKILAGLEDTSDESLVRQALVPASLTGVLGDKAWRRLVHDGFVPESAAGAARVRLKNLPSMSLTDSQKQGTRMPNGKLELSFRDSATYDGRYANNGWLVETPDFITKLAWDNAALVSPATAKDLGISNGDMLEISVSDRQLEIVAHVTPGQAAYSLSLPLGWGRKRAGYVGGHEDLKIKAPGFDTYQLRTTSGFHQVSGATVKKTGATYPLAETQDHFAMDEIGAKAVQIRAKVQIKTGTLVEYKALGEGLVTKDAHLSIDKILTRPIEGRAINASLYDEHEYKGHKWGMTIDLGKCMGCNSCMLACQAENNVPIVGKEEVMNNREMHWIRIDRFFKGNADDPEMAFQPVHCQQCEGAPCEVVCPVEATVHSDEGLNDMAYNRCVGTRYCANNCPYKVRRFNYRYWNKDFETARFKVRKLLSNPDVTVRSRGVMEKCTWCVQRIERTRIDAKNNRRPIKDGEIKTACEQACPSHAIRFGDLADKESVVYKNQELPRAYALLASLNNSPRNAFLARITNPNPALVKTGAKVKAKDHE